MHEMMDDMANILDKLKSKQNKIAVSWRIEKMIQS